MNRIAPKEAEGLLPQLQLVMFQLFPRNCDKADQMDMQMGEEGWVFDGWTRAKNVSRLSPANGAYACMFIRLESGERQWCQVRIRDFGEIGWRYKDQEKFEGQALRVTMSF